MPDRARSQSAAPHVLRQVGLWASIALIAAISALSYFSIRALVRNAEHADRTQALLREIDLLVSELKDAEIGRRGFLITGIEEYLEPYRSALDAEAAEAEAAPSALPRGGERVLLTTGYAEAAAHNGNGNSGAKAPHAHFIGKPYRKADLARTLRKALADDTKDKEKH